MIKHLQYLQSLGLISKRMGVQEIIQLGKIDEQKIKVDK